MLVERGEDVEAEPEQFEADEDDQQVLRGGDDKAAGGGHQNDGDILADMAREDGIDEQQQRERGEDEDGALRHASRATRGEEEIAAALKAGRAGDGPERHSAAGNAE